jgi:hypothetical protein
MTPEQRLNRLERVAKLFVKAGLRERRNRRELDENIKMVISAQMDNEERVARLTDAHAETERIVKELAGVHDALAAAHLELATAQKQTDVRLQALIEIVARERNGGSR